jgi:hypothetical protein
MPFLIFAGAAFFVLPVVMLLTRIKGEIILAFIAGLAVAIIFHRFGIAVLLNIGGWFLTSLSFVPGLLPFRWLKRPVFRKSGV